MKATMLAHIKGLVVFRKGEENDIFDKKTDMLLLNQQIRPNHSIL
jgi:hypothetical protein